MKGWKMWTGMALVVVGSVAQALAPIMPELDEAGRRLTEIGWALTAVGFGHKLEKAATMLKGGR